MKTQRAVHASWLLGLLGAGLLCALGACSPEIGDSCESSSDCSSNADRLCDRASPGGYCTVTDCDNGTCPDGARCVEYLFDPARLATRWCMASCGANDDCRTDDGYRCAAANDIVDAEGSPIARVVDRGDENATFCAIASAPR